jgi:hypothetical protein
MAGTNRGTRADLPPEGGLDEIKYEPKHRIELNPYDSDLEYTGENGDGQTEPVPDGLS